MKIYIKKVNGEKLMKFEIIYFNLFLFVFMNCFIDLNMFLNTVENEVNVYITTLREFYILKQKL